MKPQQGWFDSRAMIDDAWGRKWHFLRREHAGTYWSVCGPLWLVSAPKKLAEAPPVDAKICRKCAAKLANSTVHFRDGRVRAACGARPDIHRFSSIRLKVTCKLCLTALNR